MTHLRRIRRKVQGVQIALVKPGRTPATSVTPRASQAAIGPKLRAVFDKATNCPMPDRLAELSEKLDEALEQGRLSPRR